MVDKEQLIRLLDKLKSNDMSSFDEFYNLTKKSVYYSIYSVIRNEDTSKDIMQDTYISFLSSLNKIASDEKVLSYLCMIGRNNAINYYNKHKREISFDEYEDENAYGSYEEQHEDDSFLKAIKKIVNEKEYQIIIMHVLSDLSFKEIASSMHIPLGSTLWSYNNAIKKIKKGLGDKYEIQ